jgi:hypothetical protein
MTARIFAFPRKARVTFIGDPCLEAPPSPRVPGGQYTGPAEVGVATGLPEGCPIPELYKPTFEELLGRTGDELIIPTTKHELLP